jgi:methanogenic corrinoid protein MtbC1
LIAGGNILEAGNGSEYKVAMDPLLETIASAVVDLRVGDVPRAVEAALQAGVSARRVVTEGLAEGMRRVGGKFACKEYFVPEVLVASRGMYAGLAVARPFVEADPFPSAGKVVLGVVRGDRHDIGKNIVRVLLEASGFEVHDLGRDVPAERFLEVLRETGALILGLSTLMTTTMPEMAAVVKSVREAPDLAGVKVLVGGAPVTLEFARAIGADGRGGDAAEAVRLAKEVATG